MIPQIRFSGKRTLSRCARKIIFQLKLSRMLDLNFVRDNLAMVEEKLRQRGANAAEVLKDFAAIDAERRQAITAAETLQARRSRASEEIAKLKKSGQDASAQINETKELREQIQQSEKKAADQEARLRELLPA